jgi:hypothetical protein
MSGREEEEEEEGMRASIAHMMRFCTRSFTKNEEERHRGREKSTSKAKDEGQRRAHIRTSSPTFHRDLPIIIFFSHHL